MPFVLAGKKQCAVLSWAVLCYTVHALSSSHTTAVHFRLQCGSVMLTVQQVQNAWQDSHCQANAVSTVHGDFAL